MSFDWYFINRRNRVCCQVASDGLFKMQIPSQPLHPFIKWLARQPAEDRHIEMVGESEMFALFDEVPWREFAGADMEDTPRWETRP
jgi:hypothetical protein